MQAVLLAEVTDSLFSKATGSWERWSLDPELLSFKDFLSFFSICTRTFDVRREFQVSLESWQCEDSGNACQSDLRGLDPELLSFKDFLSFFFDLHPEFWRWEEGPGIFGKLTTWGFRKCLPIRSTRLRSGVIELQIFPFLFSTCNQIFDVMGETPGIFQTLTTWGFWICLPIYSTWGLVPELLGFKDFLFLWLFLQNSNIKEVVACFLEGQSIPQRNYRKVIGAFIKRSLFVFSFLY